ncbi:MAG: SU10 major capsid protein, partial [Beijerinckiaceae bacterium]
MAVPTNTLQTYQSSYNAEDVSEIIMNISPLDTPLLTLARKGSAEATYTEWPIESLAAADGNNANIEGDDAATDASTTPTRVGNYTQLVDKVFQVSTTQDAIKKYGAKNEFARQKAKKG